jgi:hypothetical protein
MSEGVIRKLFLDISRAVVFFLRYAQRGRQHYTSQTQALGRSFLGGAGSFDTDIRRTPKYDGCNLVRLLYLDEAGSDFDAPTLVVAGVIVHGDREYPLIEAAFSALKDHYLPPEDRDGFIFHAKDIYHGSRYFHRAKLEWPRERRIQLLRDLASVIDRFSLPVILASEEKSKWPHVNEPGKRVEQAGLIQTLVVMQCLVKANQWIREFAPTELAAVVHEDGSASRVWVKRVVREMRSSERGADQPKLGQIVDTVHFVEKADAPLLQLADLCAFMWARSEKGVDVVRDVFDVIQRRAYPSSGASDVGE